MESPLHKHLVERLRGEGWATRGCTKLAWRHFREWFEGKGLPGHWEDDDIESFRESLLAHGLRPDAYRLVEEGEAEGWRHPVLVLHVAEVEVSCPLNSGRVARYQNLWWDLDAMEYVHLRLFTVHRDGSRKEWWVDDAPDLPRFAA